MILNIYQMKGFGKNNNKNKFYKEFIPPSIEESINKVIKYYKYCLDNGSKDQGFYVIMD